MKKNDSLGYNHTSKVPIKHFLVIMRTTFILLFTVIFCTMAETGHSQNARVTLNKRNVTLKEALNEIESQTDYLFIYSNKVDVNEKISVKAKQQAVSTVLNDILKNKDVDYSMEGNHIILSKNQEGIKESIEAILAQQQQKKTVTGIVLDGSGEPIIGANVIERGTTNGTVTDYNGNFSIRVEDNAVLQITYIGFLPQEISTAGRSSINISLIEDTKALEELVVVGYGTQKKVNLTGAVEQVTSDVFEKRPITNATQGLVGVIPNLNIQMSDGKPTQSPSYNIRGTTSIGQGGSALVLIDGVEGDPRMLNPNDIESVSVLKDAASSAIYGARAVFGVVLITTKNASKGKTSINYTTNLSSKSPTAVPDNIVDSYIWAKGFSDQWSSWRDTGETPTAVNKTMGFSPAYLAEIKRRWEDPTLPRIEVDPVTGEYQYFYSTDWYKELYKKSLFAQDHNLTVSGGNELSSFYVSGRYNSEDGLF